MLENNIKKYEDCAAVRSLENAIANPGQASFGVSDIAGTTKGFNLTVINGKCYQGGKEITIEEARKLLIEREIQLNTRT